MVGMKELLRSEKAANLLSVLATGRGLNITRVTVYKWISMGILKPEGHELIGRRHNYWFRPDYIARIKAILPKDRRRGHPILTPELEEKLKRIA